MTAIPLCKGGVQALLLSETPQGGFVSFESCKIQIVNAGECQIELPNVQVCDATEVQ